MDKKWWWIIAIVVLILIAWFVISKSVSLAPDFAKNVGSGEDRPYRDGRQAYNDCIDFATGPPSWGDCDNCYDSCFAYCDGEYEGDDRESCLNGCDDGLSSCEATLVRCPASSVPECAGQREGFPCNGGNGVCNQNEPGEGCYCAP